MDAGNGDCAESEKCKEGNDVATTVSHEQMSKAENVWKPKIILSMQRGGEEAEDNNPEQQKTQELFQRIRSILNKLMPQTFQQLMKQVTELTINTEERLKVVIHLTFEKAISEPVYSVVYANMCRCLMGLKVPATDKPGNTVNFRKLLLNRCQKEFERDKADNEIFEKKQKELEAASSDEERQRLTEELMEAKDKEHRRSIGNIQFTCELFKLKMLTEVIMHDCIVKLLKNHDEESLECLCRLLSTIGKDLDFEKAKPRMDQYFNTMEKIIKERKTSSKIRFILQDVLDLRRKDWVPRPSNQGFKTIDQIYKESKTGGSEGLVGRGEREGHWRRGEPHTPERGRPPKHEGWNTTYHSKFTKTPVGRLDFNNQLLAPGGKGMWGTWGKGSSSTSTDPSNTGSRPATSTLNRFSGLQSSSPASFLDSDRRVPQNIPSQKFQQLTKQVIELTIDTEERLKEVIDLTFEKAVSEPDFSVACVNMCRCLMELKVPATDKPGTTVNFRKLLLNRCQKEFEKNIENNEIFEKKQKELEAASNDEERQRLREELKEAKNKEHRRSIGNIQFIGELFKGSMLTEHIMHDCIVTLIKIPSNEESLECLCQLLSTTGKELDHGKAEPCMDQYFSQMEKIIKERKTSSRIRFMLQDVLALRRCNWVPRRGDQGPKTIDQIHKEAEMEEHREQMKVQQALISKKDTGGSGGRKGGGGGPGGRGGPHTPGRGQPPQDEGWNTVSISKNRPIDTSRLSKITKTPVLDFNNQLLAPGVQKERATPPPVPSKPALTEEELERKSTAIIEEYLHVNDMKEALQCVQELNSPQLLFVFVRNGLESTLERSTMGREHLGLLLHQLVKTGILSKPQYFKGLQEILEVAEDMAIDIPHIWLYLAELITPMLHEGGIPMGELFREVAKPLIPLEKAGVLLVQILTLLCKGMSHKKAGAMWREAGLKWRDYLPEDEDVNKFVTEKNVKFTLGEESEKSQKSEMSLLELTNQLDRLIQDQADNQRIFDWIDANLDEKQTSSNMFVRALMTCICQSAIICENPYKVSMDAINQRATLLLKFLKDEQKELQALYALQALMVQMEQPANLLRMFFDNLYDTDIIKEEAFFKWESSKDPAEQTGKGVALKSVTAFFTWLREAEEESDNS